MKLNIYQNFCRHLHTTLFLFVVVLLAPMGVFASFNGNYIIDAQSKASDTLYVSFSDLISDLTSGSRKDGEKSNGPGISGIVNITVVKGSGPYYEQLIIPAISGTSEINRIIINGNNEKLQFRPTTTDKFIIKFDGAQYIELHNLHLECQGAGGRNLQISNNSQYLNIENCRFSQPENTQLTSGTAYIAFTNINSMLMAVGNPGYYNTIRGNTMSNQQKAGVFCGIYLGYNSADTSKRRNVITENLIEDFNQIAINGQFATDQVITKNEIRNNYGTASSIKGIYLYNSQHIFGQRIDSNYLHQFRPSSSSGFNGIEVNASNSTGNVDLSISGNRMVFDSLQNGGNGIYAYFPDTRAKSNVKLDNNSIQIHALESNTSTCGIYCSGYQAPNLLSADIIGNKIDVINPTDAYGINQGFSKAKFLKPIIIANNILNVRGGYNTYLLHIAGLSSQQYKVFYNSLSTDDFTPGTFKGISRFMIYNYYSKLELKNNLFFGKISDGILSAIHLSNGASIMSDHNSFYLDNAGSAYTYYCTEGGQSPIKTFDEFQQKFSSGNDINLDPLYINIADCDLTPTEEFVFNRAQPLTEITQDINGKNRDSTNPDMGAIELGSIAGTTRLPLAPFLLYPNPANNIIQISREDGISAWDIELLDLNGRILVATNLKKGHYHLDMTLPNLANGLYFVRIRSSENFVVKSIVVTGK